MKTRYEKKLRKPIQYEGDIPQYGLGGLIAGAAGLLTGGMATPLLMGAGGLVKGLVNKLQEKKDEEQKELAVGQQSGAVSLSAGGSVNNYMDPWSAGTGGVVGAGNANKVKIRNKELMVGPSGKAVTSEDLGVKTPKHTNEGIVRLPDGAVVVSPENTPQAKKIAARQKNEVAKLNKVLKNPRATKLARDSAQRRLDVLKEEYTPLLLADVQKRLLRGEAFVGGDNIPEAGLGGIFKSVGGFLGKHGAGILGGAAALAPTILNAVRGGQKEEQLNPAQFQNPMANQALQEMSSRQANVTPALQGIDRQTEIASANLRSTATGRGQYAANQVALAGGAAQATAGAYDQASRENNAYMGELAQMRAGIGQKMADTNLIVSDLNARNSAAKRNFGAEAASQIGQFAQNQQLMKNQADRDKSMMGMFRNWQGALTGNLPPTAVDQLTKGGAAIPSLSGNKVTGINSSLFGNFKPAGLQAPRGYKRG